MEFSELLQKLNIDEQEVMLRFSNNQALLKRFLLKFPDEKTFSQLKISCQNDDLEMAKRDVHTLKGIVSNFGFTKLFGLCVDLLADLRGDMLNKKSIFEECELEYQRIINIINDSIKEN